MVRYCCRLGAIQWGFEAVLRDKLPARYWGEQTRRTFASWLSSLICIFLPKATTSPPLPCQLPALVITLLEML